MSKNRSDPDPVQLLDSSGSEEQCIWRYSNLELESPGRAAARAGRRAGQERQAAGTKEGSATPAIAHNLPRGAPQPAPEMLTSLQQNKPS